jgi:hypothetical protein
MYVIEKTPLYSFYLLQKNFMKNRNIYKGISFDITNEKEGVLGEDSGR